MKKPQKLNSIEESLVVLEQKRIPQEQVLFLSVILQAFLDASKPESSNEPKEEALAREQAQAWFFASVGVTAQDFFTVCDLAGIEPEYVKSFAVKVFKTKEVNYVRKRINAVLSNKD